MKSAAWILGAGSLWGIIALFVTLLKNAGLSSMQIVAVRVALAALLLVGYLLWKDPAQLKIRWKDLPLFLGTGILSIVCFNFCYFEAIRVVGGAAIPALLLYTAPIFVMLLSLPLFRERMTWRKVAALVLTCAGLLLVTGVFSSSGETLSWYAFLLGIGSGIGYALYSIFGKFLVGSYSAVTISTYTFLVAAVATVPTSGVLGSLDLLCTPMAAGAAVALALVCTVLPYLLYTKGLQKTEAGTAAVLATVEPFVAALVGVLCFQEALTAPKLLGMLLVIAAVLLLNLHKRKPDTSAAHNELF